MLASPHHERDVMYDEKALAAELVRYWRGNTPQLVLSYDLGFNSNVVGHWERGRSSCSLSMALHMAETRHAGTLDNLAADLRCAWTDTVPMSSPRGVVMLLGDLFAGVDIASVAKRSRLSRHKLGRWLRGDTEPNLPEFIAGLNAVGISHTVVPLLAPGLQLASSLPDRVTMDQLETLHGLMTSRYRELPVHDPQALAEWVGHPVETVDAHLVTLRELGLIRWRDPKWKLTDRPLDGSLLPASFLEYNGDRISRHGPFWGRSMLTILDRDGLYKAAEILRRAHRELAQHLVESEVNGRDVFVVNLCITSLVPLEEYDYPPRPVVDGAAEDE